jgi:hypothetical protein
MLGKKKLNFEPKDESGKSYTKKTLILTPCFDIKKPPPKKKKPVNGIQRRL